MAHKYTPEHINWLRDNRDAMSESELAAALNVKFNANVSQASISNALKRYGIKVSPGNANRGQFKQGSIPWNTGLKGVNGDNNPGQFKPGLIPSNHLPVGSVRYKADGYLDIKISEGNRKWRALNRVVWEQYHGEIPDNHVVIFLDSNPHNCDIENLKLISRGELALLNRYGEFKQQAPVIKQSMIAVTRLEMRAKQCINTTQKAKLTGLKATNMDEIEPN
jgi:hypothetical protein